MNTQSTTLELKVAIKCGKSLQHTKLTTQTKGINCREKAFGTVETVSGNEGIRMEEGDGLIGYSYPILTDDGHQFVSWTNGDPATHSRNLVVHAFSQLEMESLKPLQSTPTVIVSNALWKARAASPPA